MSNVRISQRLTEAYNPDGTPGTVTTGTPGPPPADDVVLAAVSTYLSLNPPSYPTAPLVASVHNLFGAAATGQPGAYVDVGGLVDGQISVGGSISTANLTLKSKGGTVIVDDPFTANGAALLGNGVDVVGNVRVLGRVTLADATRGTSLASFTAGLADVMATPVYTYLGSDGSTTRRGLKTADVPTALKDNGKLDLLGMVATLWRAVQQLNGG